MTSFVDNSNQEYDHAPIPGMIFLQDIVNDRPVVLLGSAPEVDIPYHDLNHSLLVSINSSALSIPRNIIPDITIINTTIAKPGELREIKRTHLNQLTTKSLFIMEGPISLSAALPIFDSVSRETTGYMTLSERSEFLEYYLAKPLEGYSGPKYIPSTGFIACLLLLACGASSVRMTGFSFSDGHSYLAKVFKRQHIAKDLDVMDYIIDTEKPVHFPDQLIKQRQFIKHQMA